MASAESMQQLAGLLQATFSPDATTRKSAEAQLSALQRQPGFGALPLGLSTSEGLDKSIRQAAALLYKNYIKQHWNSVRSFALSCGFVLESHVLVSTNRKKM